MLVSRLAPSTRCAVVEGLLVEGYGTDTLASFGKSLLFYRTRRELKISIHADLHCYNVDVLQSKMCLLFCIQLFLPFCLLSLAFITPIKKEYNNKVHK